MLANIRVEEKRENSRSRIL